MKYIRSYQGFKNSKSNTTEENYYYKVGKKTQKTILECALISEGISYDSIEFLKESVNFKNIDNEIVDTIYNSLIKESNTSDDIMILEEGVFGTLIDGAKDLWDKGVEIGKTVFKSFKDFLSKIGDIVKTMFGKIKAFFIKLWEIFKPKALAVTKTIVTGVKSGGQGAIQTLTTILGDKSTQSELIEASKDIQSVSDRFQKGDMGNMSTEAGKHLEGEAEEYKDVTDTSEIEELIKDNFNIQRKSSIKKVYYSLKGYLLEGGNVSKLYNTINESDGELKVGDRVKYTSKSGEELEKEIIKIEGDTLTFNDKEGNEFTKQVGDVTKVGDTGVESKDTGGVKGGKGMFGWIVEGVGFILSPISKLTEWLIKAGSNGAITMVSSIARRGINNAYKYVVIGTLCGLVYHIIHAITSVWNHFSHGHGGAEHGGAKHGGDGDVKSTEAKVAAEHGGVKAAEVVNKVAAAAHESVVNESVVVPKIPTVDPSKRESKLKGLIADSSKILIPITGGVLLKALGLFSPTLTLILEMILIAIGVFELVGAVCELKEDFKDNPVCKMQHRAHRFLAGGGSH